MPSEKMAKAEKLGDDFYRGSFKGIRPITSLISKLIIIIIVLELIDEIPDIIVHFQADVIGATFHIIEVIVPVILAVFILKLLKKLEKWEETYKSIKKLID